MRIGLFTDTYLPDINGVVSSTVTLKKALEKEGHTVFVITNHAGSKIEMADNILRLPGIPLKGLYGYKMSSPISMRAGSYIRNMNLDVIHLQTNFGVGIYGQTLAKSLGIPLVDTYHTMYEDYTHYINPLGLSGVERVSKDAIRAASRQVCNHVQAVISPSLKTKEILEEYGVKAPIYVVPTGLDLTAFEKAGEDAAKLTQIRSRVSTDPDAVIFVFVGRLAKEKSLEIPIQAFAQMEDPRFHLAVVGAGPDEDYYESLVHRLGAEKKVHFLGKADPEEIGYYYKAFDAFVSASLSETQGMTYLESMATGTMVFGRRDEVLDGLIKEGKTGYYFDTEEELQEKIQAFLQLDPAQRQANALLCKERIAPYTDRMFAHKALAVYNQAIEDYSHTFVVDKIKFENDFVSLTLFRDSEKEPVRILIPLEDYFELKISPQTKLDVYLVESYQEQQEYFKAWSRVKKYVFAKPNSKAQIFRYCRYTLGLGAGDAQSIVEELVERKLLDDRALAKDRAEYWQLIGYSRQQISQKLAKMGLEKEDIAYAQDALHEDLEERNARAMAKRLVNTVKAQSARLKRQTIVNKLLSKGYSLDMARKASEELEFEDDEQSLRMAYEKACRLYSSYPKDKKKEKIKGYCIRKGFSGYAVEELMERMMEHD